MKKSERDREGLIFYAFFKQRKESEVYEENG